MPTTSPVTPTIQRAIELARKQLDHSRAELVAAVYESRADPQSAPSTKISMGVLVDQPQPNGGALIIPTKTHVVVERPSDAPLPYFERGPIAIPYEELANFEGVQRLMINTETRTVVQPRFRLSLKRGSDIELLFMGVETYSFILACDMLLKPVPPALRSGFLAREQEYRRGVLAKLRELTGERQELQFTVNPLKGTSVAWPTDVPRKTALEEARHRLDIIKQDINRLLVQARRLRASEKELADALNPVNEIASRQS